MARVEPTINPEIEARRVVFTYKNHIFTPESENLGAGDVSDARMQTGIEQIQEAFQLPRAPQVLEVFNRSFLPPRAERALPRPAA
jgi:NitT/TauT family transport system substrate-binding protein